MVVPSSGNSSSTIKVFSNEKIQNLKHLIYQFNHSSAISTSKIVKSGIAHFSAISNFDTWIIHSEANKHMTDLSKDFLTYFSCIKQENIRIADVSYTPVFETGYINFTPTSTLSSVLQVLSFSDSLLY